MQLTASKIKYIPFDLKYMQCVLHFSQGQCGASYAFAAIGSLEGMNALANEKMISLSEQNIIDCSGNTHTELEQLKHICMHAILCIIFFQLL